MNKQISKSKLSPVSVPQPPKSPPVSASQPIHDIPQPGQFRAAGTTHDDVARRAYQIYVEQGYPQGQSEQNWQQAEREHRYQGLAALRTKLPG
jgi:hypothetical protein